MSILVMLEFDSGNHHVGAAGRYLSDANVMSDALSTLDTYLAWGRAHLESM